MVKLHYLRSNFIGHSTHTDLYWEFGSALKEFNGNKRFRFLWVELTSISNF